MNRLILDCESLRFLHGAESVGGYCEPPAHACCCESAAREERAGPEDCEYCSRPTWRSNIGSRASPPGSMSPNDCPPLCCSTTLRVGYNHDPAPAGAVFIATHLVTCQRCVSHWMISDRRRRRIRCETAGIYLAEPLPPPH